MSINRTCAISRSASLSLIRKLLNASRHFGEKRGATSARQSRRLR